jgi:hypothetical protein
MRRSLSIYILYRLSLHFISTQIKNSVQSSLLLITIIRPKHHQMNYNNINSFLLKSKLTINCNPQNIKKYSIKEISTKSIILMQFLKLSIKEKKIRCFAIDLKISLLIDSKN